MNSTDVTSSVSNNQYTVSNIKANITVEVEFEAIPVTTYTLSIKATGNGSATYNGTTAKNNTQTFTLNEGTSATITFAPDNGYRIKIVKVNSTDVTSSVSNNSYTVSSISVNTTVEVEFEAIPIPTYTLSVTATGNGSAIYNGTTAKNNTQTFTLNEGTSATITFAPDNGYRIKSVKVNSTDVTSSISNKQYTVSNIKVNTTVEVDFEAIPIPTYTLSVKATGNGSAIYSGTTATNNTQTFTLNEGTSATITFAPDNGYRIKSVKLNSTDVTSSVSNNQYTVSNIKTNTTVEVEFEIIPKPDPTPVDQFTENGINYHITGLEQVEVIETKTNVSSISIPSSVSYNGTTYFVLRIGNYAFYQAKTLTSVTIPTTVKSIGISAFEECNGLTQITLPGSIVSIGVAAFRNCSNLKRVMTEIVSPNDIDDSVFEGINPDAALQIPKGSKMKYLAASGWTSKNFASIEGDGTMYRVIIEISGNGNVKNGNSSYRNKTVTFIKDAGLSMTLSFAPDKGYRVKSLTVNNEDETEKISNDLYVIRDINKQTIVKVEFDKIVTQAYTLSITALGDGSATYNNEVIQNTTMMFTINEGDNALITFTPANGNRIKSVKVNGSDVTTNVSNNRYSINNISSNTSLNVEFEAIPPTIYTLTISATGSGHVSCNDISVENGTQSISVENGSSVIIKFYPNDGHQIKIAKVNNTDVTSSISNNQYTIKIDGNTTLEVEFEEIVNSMIVDGVNYVVNDQQAKNIQVAAGDYELVLEVPASVVYNNQNWAVVGIEQNALANCTELAAVIWEPEVQFDAKVNNPNFLLYVSDEKYASRNVKNVVVNDIAENIELIDEADGNNFYCPRVFKANNIIYKHNYQMDTGIGDSRGWETIVLPFDVQKYTHATKGELEPFTTWTIGSSKKPFWLFELTADGYKDVAGIKANTPYIISMPNNQQYEHQYQIPGVVTFSASNVEVQKSDNLKPASYQDRSLVPNYTNKSDENYLALNVSNNYVSNPGKDISGSKFVRGLRAVHPFEAYMITTDNTRSIDVMDGLTTAIRGIQMVNDGASEIKVYDTRGVLMKMATCMDDVKKGLKAGVYIVNGKKMVIK